MCETCIYQRKDGTCKHPDYTDLWLHGDCKHQEELESRTCINCGHVGTDVIERLYWIGGAGHVTLQECRNQEQCGDRVLEIINKTRGEQHAECKR